MIFSEPLPKFYIRTANTKDTANRKVNKINSFIFYPKVQCIFCIREMDTKDTAKPRGHCPDIFYIPTVGI